MITKETLLDVMPKRFRTIITDDIVDFINTAETDHMVIEDFRDNFLTYSKILTESKFTLYQYTNAIRFVTFIMLGHKDRDAYAFTFPEKIEKMRVEYASRPEMYDKMLAGYTHKYKSSKLVTQILQQTIVPSYVYNAPYFQEALVEAVKIMKSSKSDIARVNACNTVLNYTKPPEDQVVQLNIGVKDSESVSDLKQLMEELATTQLEMMDKGIPLKTIAETALVPSNKNEEEEED